MTKWYVWIPKVRQGLTVLLVLLTIAVITHPYRNVTAQTPLQIVGIENPAPVGNSVTMALSLYSPYSDPDPVVTPTITPAKSPVSSASAITAIQYTGNDYCLYVPIILYHHVEPLAQATQEGHAQLTVDSTYFDQQMAYLKNAGYTSITIDQLATALIHKTPLPAKSIAITLDDGYIDGYVYAYPILKKYNLIGNFMIPAGLIENPDYMSWPQVREMYGNGQAIYNHTWSHAALAEAGREKIIQEVMSANDKLDAELQTHITAFTYPYGSFDNQAVNILKELGFVIGLTTIPGRMQCTNNIMTLYRDHIGNAPMSTYGL